MNNNCAENEVFEIKSEVANAKLCELIKSEGFEKYDIKVTSGSKKGDNYIGILYRIVVEGATKCGLNKSLYLVGKFPPENASRRKEFRVANCFTREAMVYNEILPHFQKMQDDKGITDGSFNEYVKCYVTSDILEDEYLIMEDARKQDFVMFDRFKRIDVDHVKLVMRALGKLHSFSFAMRDQHPDDLEKYAKLEDVFFRKDLLEANFESYLYMLVDQATDTLDEDDITSREVMKKYKKNVITGIEDCVTGKHAEPYAVVTHGDCWNNNMLFKYENNKPTDIRLLDWQICRYATPVLDLLYYIFCCTDKPFRDQHYESCLKTYYESLSEMLTRLGSDPEKMFPYSAFETQLKRFGKYGLFMSMMLVKIIVTDAKDAPDLDDIAEKMQKDKDALKDFLVGNESVDKIYKTRMGDVIRDMIRLGYVN